MKFAKEQQVSLPGWISAIEELAKIRIIRLKGDIDALAVSRLEQFAALIRQQKNYVYKHILLDFAEVVSMDSAAVAALLKALREYKKTHQKLALSNLKEGPRNIIRLAKVGHLFPSYSTEAKALKDLETRF